MHQPLSYVHPGAKIDKTVVIEPFVTIENNVVIEQGTWIGSNVTIMEGARIGENCRIFPGAVISAIPQDLKFNGEDSVVEIGELALQVKDLINKKAKIIRPDIDESLSPDKYIGSRSEYESLINKLEIKESSLQDQIVNTSEYMKVAYNLK